MHVSVQYNYRNSNYILIYFSQSSLPKLLLKKVAQPYPVPPTYWLIIRQYIYCISHIPATKYKIHNTIIYLH